MLVLRQRKDECIFIDCPDGSRLTLQYSGVENGKAKLCFDGPKEYQVWRETVLRKRQAEAKAKELNPNASH